MRWMWGMVTMTEPAASRALELAAAWATLATGVWYALPVATFASTPAFRAFALWVPETVTGLLMVAIGGCVVWGPRSWRTPALWLVVAGWAFSAGLFLVGNPAGTGWLWSGLFAAMGIWSAVTRRSWGGRDAHE